MRKLNFSDGFSSSQEPSIGQLPANQYQKFADDTSFVSDKGSPASASDIYFNTTLNCVRYFDGTNWQNVATEEALTTLEESLSSDLSDLEESFNEYTGETDQAIEDIEAELATKADASDLNQANINLMHHEQNDTAHGTSSAIVGVSDTQVLSNKDIDGGTASNTSRITLPKNTQSNLESLVRKEGTLVYSTDKKKPYVDNGDRLVPVGSGSGGVENLIPNPRGDEGIDGWEYETYTAADKPSGTPTSGASNLTLTAETGSLSATGENRFTISKDAVGAQGQAVSTVFEVPTGYQASVLKLEILYKTTSGNFLAGSPSNNSSLIWYCAQSSDGGSSWSFLEPSSFNMLTKGMPDTLTGFVQVGPSVTHLKLIAYVSETATTSWEVDFEASVSKTSYAYGTIVTASDYYKWTPIVTGAGTAVFDAAYGSAGRVGDRLVGNFRLEKGATAGSGASVVKISLPPGLSIDTSKQPFISTSGAGGGQGITSGSVEVSFLTDDPNNIIILSGGVTLVGSSITTGMVVFRGEFSIPIQGWSSGAQLADGYDGRVVSYSGVFSGQTVPFGSVTNLTSTTIMDTVTGKINATDYVVKSAGYYRVDALLNLIGPTGVATQIPYGMNITVNGTILSSSATSDTIRANKAGQYLQYSPRLAVELPNRYLNVGDIIRVTVQHYANNGTDVSAVTTSGSLNIYKLSGAAFMTPTATVAVIATNTSGQSIPSTTSTNITNWTKSLDTHGAFNASTGVFTAPEAGVYVVSLGLAYEGTTWASGNTVEARITSTGDSGYRANNVYPITNQYWVTPIISGQLFSLKEGDTIRPSSYQDSGGSRTLSTTVGRNHLSIYKVK